MNNFLIYFAIIALAVGFFLSRAGWGKMLLLVPVGALVPAFFGTAAGCGADFALHALEAGRCRIGEAEPFRFFAAYFAFGLVAVLVASVLVKGLREVIGKAKGA